MRQCGVISARLRYISQFVDAAGACTTVVCVEYVVFVCRDGTYQRPYLNERRKGLVAGHWIRPVALSVTGAHSGVLSASYSVTDLSMHKGNALEIDEAGSLYVPVHKTVFRTPNVLGSSTSTL